MQVFQTADGRGNGLRTTKPIPANKFIIEYTGERIGALLKHERIAEGIVCISLKLGFRGILTALGGLHFFSRKGRLH